MPQNQNMIPEDYETGKRQDHEPPAVTAMHGWRYQHLGVPTDVPMPGKYYLEYLEMYASGFETSPYGIEWMRFEQGSPVSELVRSVPHIAFAVDDLDSGSEGKQVLPNSLNFVKAEHSSQ
jgi:hypothetical protein